MGNEGREGKRKEKDRKEKGNMDEMTGVECVYSIVFHR